MLTVLGTASVFYAIYVTRLPIRTMPWSPRLGITVVLVSKFGRFVRKRYRIVLPLVGVLLIWYTLIYVCICVKEDSVYLEWIVPPCYLLILPVIIWEVWVTTKPHDLVCDKLKFIVRRISFIRSSLLCDKCDSDMYMDLPTRGVVFY